MNESLIRSSFSTQESKSPNNIKRSFDLNCAVNMINGNLSHGLPFQQKSFIKQKPMMINSPSIKKVISGCNLVDSIMEGECLLVDDKMQYCGIVFLYPLC